MADTPLENLDQLKIGDFVKLTDRDKSGKFSHVGEVVTIQKAKKKDPGYFEMMTFEGTMGFLEDQIAENDLNITTIKPTGWAKFKKDPKKFVEAKQEAEKVVPVKTKKQQVMELVAANPRKKEDSLLKLAKKEIGGSEAQLRTYVKLALAKK